MILLAPCLPFERTLQGYRVYVTSQRPHSAVACWDRSNPRATLNDWCVGCDVNRRERERERERERRLQQFWESSTVVVMRNSDETFQTNSDQTGITMVNTLRTRSFKLFKRPVPGVFNSFNPLNAELNPICYLLALLAHHFLYVSRIRVKSLTLRLLISYIYIYIYIRSAYSWCF